jgi:hypothetical protein
MTFFYYYNLLLFSLLFFSLLLAKVVKVATFITGYCLTITNLLMRATLPYIDVLHAYQNSFIHFMYCYTLFCRFRDSGVSVID